jgi:CheY-like chemotaxis protein
MSVILALMKITCVLCHKEYVFDQAKVPEGGFRIGCSVCGAKYTVSLPDGWRDFGKADPVPEPATGAPDAEDHFILMADDTAFFRSMMSDLLIKNGFKVKTAADGQEAMDIFKASPDSFILLVLDLQMPKLSGFGVLEELKKMQRPLPPIVVMTGVHDSHEDINIVREMGASGFLDKSLDPSVLLERINMILEQNKGQG